MMSQKDLRQFNFSVKTLKQQFNLYTQAVQSYSKDYPIYRGAIKNCGPIKFRKCQTVVGGKTKSEKEFP